MPSSSLVTPPETQAFDVTAVASRLLEARVESIEPLGGGRNSQVYLLRGGSGDRYVMKRYVACQTDGRDRLAVEFLSLQFLWEQGIQNIPRPIRCDRDNRCALYEYLDGNPMAPDQAAPSDVDEAVAFLAQLHALRHHPRTRGFPAASEACFSAAAIVVHVHQRLARLASANGRGPHLAALQDFLRGEFEPALQTMTRWSQDGFARTPWRFDAILPSEDRTLSPSDFGFHNAIRRGDGHLAFVDFEYFGWDDPAKTIVDFILHPAMALSEELQRYAVGRLLKQFDEGGVLARRLGLLYPLWGLKWCLIFLNEFVPHDQQRRVFARRIACGEELYATQLSKARAMLQHICDTYAQRPYPT